MDSKELIELLKEAIRSYRYFDAPEGFELVDDGEWTQDGKYQHNECVVQHTATGKCFAVTQCRSGSYHTDWDYQTPEVTGEVKKETVTVTTEKWVDA